MILPLTYAITVCNELEEIIQLVQFLLPKLLKDDEILIQYDTDSATKEVVDYLNIISQIHSNSIQVINFPLNNDFATFKNNLKRFAKGIYIFQLDADEMPSEYLIDNMSLFLENNNEVDLFFVPRINTVDGLTEEHIKKWGWAVNDKGWVQWPDFQTRLYRRTSEIEWVGAVHERIVGYNTLSVLPAKEPYCIYHHKTIERQELQNDYYLTLS